MRISVFGCGYLGAVHAACMATLGHEVVGVDVVEAQVAALSRRPRRRSTSRASPSCCARRSATGRLAFTTDAAAAAGAEVHFVCVGTPQKRGENAADLRYVNAAVDDLLPHLRPGDVVVGKSTVPVGTAELLAERIAEREPGGARWSGTRSSCARATRSQDTLHPDRLVYGVRPDDEAGARAARVARRGVRRRAGRRAPRRS